MDHDTLLPAKQVCNELGDISLMTLRRWRMAGSIPEPVVIRGKNYWLRSVVELLKNQGDGSSAHPTPGTFRYMEPRQISTE